MMGKGSLFAGAGAIGVALLAVICCAAGPLILASLGAAGFLAYLHSPASLIGAAAFLMLVVVIWVVSRSRHSS